MAYTPRNRKKPNSQGGRIAALAVLVLVMVAVLGYLLVKPGRQPVAHKPHPLPITATQPPAPPVQHSRSTSVLPQLPPTVPSYHPSEVRNTEEPQGTKPRVTGSGKLAIIIDDMGSSMQEARSLAGIGVPLTFSVIPGLRSYRDVAAFADAKGLEVMIHIPMQSKGWPERRLEANGLLVSMPDAAVAGRMSEFMQALPMAKGANNHMGSEFTEHEAGMRTVVTSLKERKLFFIDSVTSPETVGVRLAKEAGIKTARRNVFLDNEQKREYILGQLGQAVRMAKKNGSAIAICHPHPETIRTLAAALPGLARQGVSLVPASQLVR